MKSRATDSTRAARLQSRRLGRGQRGRAEGEEEPEGVDDAQQVRGGVAVGAEGEHRGRRDGEGEHDRAEGQAPCDPEVGVAGRRRAHGSSVLVHPGTAGRGRAGASYHATSRPRVGVRRRRTARRGSGPYWACPSSEASRGSKWTWTDPCSSRSSSPSDFNA